MKYFIFICTEYTSKVRDRFYTTKIVPELIDAPPEGFLSVDFPSGESVCLGNHLNFYDTLLEPKLNWKAKSGKLYTVMMIDMDAPLPEKKELLSPFVHLLVVNVK